MHAMGHAALAHAACVEHVRRRRSLTGGTQVNADDGAKLLLLGLHRHAKHEAGRGERCAIATGVTVMCSRGVERFCLVGVNQALCSADGWRVRERAGQAGAPAALRRRARWCARLLDDHGSIHTTLKQTHDHSCAYEREQRAPQRQYRSSQNR